MQLHQLKIANNKESALNNNNFKKTLRINVINLSFVIFWSQVVVIRY